MQVFGGRLPIFYLLLKVFWLGGTSNDDNIVFDGDSGEITTIDDTGEMTSCINAAVSVINGII